MAIRLINTRWLQLQLDTLDGNYHGPKFTPLRRTCRWVRMGAYVHCWTLYIYKADGSTINIRITFPKWRGEWPKSAGQEPTP